MLGLDDLTACVLFIVVLSLTYYVHGQRRQYTNLPPGPTAYPIVGNLPQFSGRNFIKTLRKFRKEYGDIYTVDILGRRIIVIAGYENVKEALVKQGSEFSNRPFSHSSRFKGHGLVMANGEIWKHNRRFTIHTLRDFGMGKNRLQHKIHEEIGHFLDAVDEHRGQPFDIKGQLSMAVSNIICSMVFGERFDYLDEKFLSYVRGLDEVVRSAVFPKPGWLRHLPFDPFNVTRTYRLLDLLRKFYKTNIDEHFREFDRNNIRDLIDSYTKQMKGCNEDGKASLMNDNVYPKHRLSCHILPERGICLPTNTASVLGITTGETQMKDDNLLRIVHDIFLAGTETTTTILRFALVFLLRNPDIQARLSDDIQNKVPQNRLPDLSDKPKLTYLEATIFEVLRRSVMSPYSVPHSVREETKFRGYTIPKSALIFPDMESVLMDDVLWDDPQAFDPARFLDENMEIKNSEYLIPFSIGPRMCLGESMAKMELYLFLSAMLQRFEFLPPEGGDPPNLDFVYSQLCTPKPFKLRAIRK